MNHDYAHCLDYSKSCPAGCFRGELVRDLQNGVPVSWMHFEGTSECQKQEQTETDVPFYDREETYTNCTVQVLTNSVTGAVSIGWWENETEESS